jgi:multimeric flavodoxin WrbA
MKLLALLGYPRVDGHTAAMTDLFLRGAASAGADIRRVHLPTTDLRPCRGCYSCWTRTPGICIHRDEMPPLLDAFLDADLVLIASPVYAFSVSVSVKTFMERTLAILSPGAEVGPNGIERNRWRYPGRGPQRMAGLLVAGRRTPDIIQPSIDTLQLYSKEMRMSCSGVLVRPESCALRFPQAKPLRMRAVRTAFERAGAAFVREERIPEEYLQAAAGPLLADLAHFVRYSIVFWEHALACQEECDAAGKRAGDDVRILMYEMARYLNPVAARGVKAVLQFDFPDRGWQYVLRIEGGACEITEGETAKPDLLIRCPAELWSAVIQRTITGSQLAATPALQVEGDLDLFRRLPRYFPPPAE